MNSKKPKQHKPSSFWKNTSRQAKPLSIANIDEFKKAYALKCGFGYQRQVKKKKRYCSCGHCEKAHTPCDCPECGAEHCYYGCGCELYKKNLKSEL